MRKFVFATLALLLTTNAHAQGTVMSSVVGPVLSASGMGEAKVSPNRASVMINVQTRAATAAAAAADNAKRTRAVFDAMAKLGLPKDQVTTEGYSVYPEMQYGKDGGVPRVAGYVATNTVKAETKQIDQAGSIIDAALAAGANLVNGVTFFASSIEQGRREAIGMAVSSARADADAMARAAGGSVGELIELTTGGPTVPPRPMYEMAAMKSAMAPAAPTPMNPGDLTVTVHVTARWRFVPSR